MIMRASIRFLSLAAATGAAFGATPAVAQVQLGDGFSLSGSATLLTDYRYRGISQSNEEPAVQATLDVFHISGFYAGAFATSLANDPRYGRAEIDIYAGFTREIMSATNLDVGIAYQIYPGNDSSLGRSDYFEPYASLSHTLGPATLTGSIAYAFNQGEATDGGDNLYLATELAVGIPATPITLTGHIGYSDGSLAPTGNYLDWRVGAELRTGAATFGLHYVDTDLPGGGEVGSTVVASLRFGF
jgi:uncharacterized protein (TIGR02001 family)